MKSEFLESELELYVQRLLVHEFYSTNNRYRMLKISPSEERLKGYDAEIVGLTPFYCQFKTSDFSRKGGLYKSRSTFCESRKWPITPFYSFPLRIPSNSNDKKDPKVWQHNILHKLWAIDRLAVAYVAPLFHTKTEMDLLESIPSYTFCAWNAPRFLRSGISIRQVAINGISECRLPAFDGLISIPPHAPVKDLKHSYAFTSHQDITFHSDPESVEGGKLLGDALKDFVVSSIKQEKKDGQRALQRDGVQAMLGGIGKDAEFLNSFLAFGLLQAGVPAPPIGTKALDTFERVGWLQQHVALAASLKAYFGISTLGLLKLKEQ
jgi:hypothetical protein